MLKIQDLKKCLIEKNLIQCHEKEDYSLTLEITEEILKQEHRIPDSHRYPTDVITGYNGKKETVLNIHTTDKAVANNEIKTLPNPTIEIQTKLKLGIQSF